MTSVERLFPSFQWGEPLQKGGTFEVETLRDELHVGALLPRYEMPGHPSDLLKQYDSDRKKVALGKKRTGQAAPHIVFVNAQNDQDLVTFVRTFGPVVAKSVTLRPSEQQIWPVLKAQQDMQELRNERLIYHAALSLVTALTRQDLNFETAQGWIRVIATHIAEWPKQWERERSEMKREPFWKLRTSSLSRIQSLSSGPAAALLPAELDSRIVLCELLNVFPSVIFPNPTEMHSSIRYGIRPLLYAVLRREFLHAHDLQVCANKQCRVFFELERAGQRFCCTDCSLRQRQRDYWQRRGKKLRRKRERNKKQS